MAKKEVGLDEIAEQFGISISDPSEQDSVEPTNAVIYGFPGTGKTGLAATAPSPLIIDFERGAAATARAINKLYDNTAKVVVIEDIVLDLDKIYRMLKSGRSGFQTVVLDPVGEMQRMLMTDIIERYPTRRVYGDQPGVADWGKAGSEAVKIITKFRALPMHTVVVAHAKQPKDEGDEESPIMPLVQGKQFGPYLMGAMDLLAYTYLEPGKAKGDPIRRLLQTKSNGRIVAKNRGERLPSLIEDPNLTDIFAEMEATE